MLRFMWIFLISIIFLNPAIAETFVEDEKPSTQLFNQDEILLKDGTLLRGTIIEEHESLIVFKTKSLGRIEIPREKIARLSHGAETSGAILDPDQNSIMFCPTPATMPKGDGYFRDFELLILNFGFGVSDNFDLSFGTLFPISTEFFMFSVGGKFRLIDRDQSSFGLALTGSFTKIDDYNFGAFGMVAGIGDAHNSLNLAINRTFNEDSNTDTVFLIGGDFQASRRIKLFAEYLSSSSLFDEDDLNGFINIGFRVFGERHSFSLSGFRPLTTDGGSFIAFPMLNYSVHW